MLWFVCALGIVAPCAAFANDGGIAFGGSPDLLKGHPTISMESEVVRLDVGEKMLTADCTFRFRNRGPACTVRMGFPDVGEGAYDPDEEDADAMKHPPRTTFTSFHSYIEGKPVETKLIRAKEEGHFWHTKQVTFPANSTLTIRDVYTQYVGTKIGEHNTNPHQVGYVLHTGASWHGPIGRSEIVFTFQRPGRPAFQSAREGNGILQDDQLAKHPDEIFYAGPHAPQVQGNTVRFVCTNWRPTPKDDITLYYDAERLKLNGQ